MILLAGAVAGRGGPALAGAAALTGVYLLVHLMAPAALGAGDVKLAIGLGGLAGCFGVDVWLLAALAAPLLTALCGVVGMLRGVQRAARPVDVRGHRRRGRVGAAAHGMMVACCVGSPPGNRTAERWWPSSKAWSPA